MIRAEFGSPLIDTAARLLVPYMLLFALYVLFHGHHSPGGGFQGGTVLAAALILVRLVRGGRPGWGLSRRGAAAAACLGVLVYAGVGLAPLFFGANYLDYAALPAPLPVPQRRWLGILGVEIGVTIAVMGTMLLIFDLLADSREDPS